MPKEILQNGSQTTLSAAISSTSATSITVTTGSVFPSTGNFHLLVESEIMVCTARSSNTLTVVRGQEGTTPATHASGLPITMILTQGTLQRYGRDNDPFFDSSRPAFASIVDANGNPLTLSSFTAVNTGNGVEASDQNGTIVLAYPALASAAWNTNAYVRPQPSTPYSVVAGFRMIMATGPLANNSEYLWPGICFRNSSNSNLFLCSLVPYNYVWEFRADWMANDTSGVEENLVSQRAMYWIGDTIWMKGTNDGANITWYLSHDGINWVQMGQWSATAYFTPNEVGFFASNYDVSTGAIVTLVHWDGA